ncbi:MAG TPA: DUF4260 domain-containing protein [Gemmatimonadales bacterium]|nr:DUF4260 domain-containing protein [Gemmatimonadales bacterium]
MPESTAFLPSDVRLLLRLEGLVVFALSTALYARTGTHGIGLFLGLFLLPDLSMLGYLGGPRAGALVYNAAHTYLLPALLGAAAWFWLGTFWLAVALIWTAHIGFDRLLGYGLKFPAAFQLTHLGAVGRARRGQPALEPGENSKLMDDR